MSNGAAPTMRTLIVSTDIMTSVPGSSDRTAVPRS
jgi:hypothetical protein